jgi:hypothetical protein
MQQQNDPLEALDAVVVELEQHCARLQQFSSEQELTPAMVAQEMVDTVMSIMRDGLGAALESIVMMREYLHEEVEPALQDLAEPDSQLTPEDAASIREQLLVLRDLLDKAASLHAGNTPEGKTALDIVGMRLQRLTAVFARLEEIELREEPDDEDEEPSGLQLVPPASSAPVAELAPPPETEPAA